MVQAFFFSGFTCMAIMLLSKACSKDHMLGSDPTIGEEGDEGEKNQKRHGTRQLLSKSIVPHKIVWGSCF